MYPYWVFYRKKTKEASKFFYVKNERILQRESGTVTLYCPDSFDTLYFDSPYLLAQEHLEY